MTHEDIHDVLAQITWYKRSDRKHLSHRIYLQRPRTWPTPCFIGVPNVQNWMMTPSLVAVTFFTSSVHIEFYWWADGRYEQTGHAWVEENNVNLYPWLLTLIERTSAL